jgi:aspartyl protease family protein
MRGHTYLRETKPPGGPGFGWVVLILAVFFLLPAIDRGQIPFIHAAHVISLAAAPNGHFYADGTVNGVQLHLMVDSGATQTTIPVTLVSRLNLGPLVFNHTASTANGSVRDAAVTIRELTISGVTFHDVSAVVTAGTLDEPLLGQSFLNGLQSYHVQNRIMTLRY